MSRKRVLFVCLGNICRSPLARALFEQRANERGMSVLFEIDSCGTSGLHAGENADSRTISNARKNGLSFKHKARQLQPTDAHEFDYIIAMDESNINNAITIFQATNPQKEIHLLRKFENNQPVPDPWYGGEEVFEEVFHMIDRNVHMWLDYFKEKYFQPSENITHVHIV